MIQYSIYKVEIKNIDLEYYFLEKLRKKSKSFMFELTLKRKCDLKAFLDVDEFRINDCTYSNLNDNWKLQGINSLKPDDKKIKTVLEMFRNLNRKEYSTFIIVFDEISRDDKSVISVPNHGYELADSGYAVSGNYLSNYILLFKNYLDDYTTFYVCYESNVTDITKVNKLFDLNLQENNMFKILYAPSNNAERTKRERVKEDNEKKWLNCIAYVKNMIKKKEFRLSSSYYLKTVIDNLGREHLIVDNNLKKEFNKKVPFSKQIMNNFISNKWVYKKKEYNEYSFIKSVNNNYLQINILQHKKGHKLEMAVLFFGNEFCFEDRTLYCFEFVDKESIDIYYKNVYFISEMIYELLFL